MSTLALPDNFEIAPNLRVKSWKSLSLNEAESDTADWKKAIAILDARIRSRFIEPAQLLIDADRDQKHGTTGFAVLAIDFLLIETMEGFRRGLTNHDGKSKKLFKSYLTSWPAFLTCVPQGGSVGDLALSIYEQGRCSLHHTGSTDRIVVIRNGKMLIFHDDGRIEINRSLFHQELTKAFDDYLDDLRRPTNTDLRKKFKNKMNHICT